MIGISDLGGLQEVIDRFAENYFLVLKFSQSKIIRQVYWNGEMLIKFFVGELLLNCLMETNSIILE
jgi:hypothetical protein